MSENYLKALNESPKWAELKAKLLDHLEKLSSGQVLEAFKPGTLELTWKLNSGEPCTKWGCDIRLIITGTKVNEVYEDYAYAAKYWDDYHYDRKRVKDREEPKKIMKEFPNIRLGTIIGVELSPYPVCCGLYQANNFFYGNYFVDKQEEITSELMSFITGTFIRTVSVRACRLAFIFVEHGSNRRENLRDQLEYMSFQEKSLVAIPPEDDSTISMSYPCIYNWARKQASYQELLQYNANSRNILHMASVVINNGE